MVPIERTTLRGTRIYAAITGRDLAEPVKEQDAVWHFIFRAHGENAKPKFKPEQLQLALAMDYEEFAQIELRREELNEVPGSDVPTKVSKYCIIRCCLCITHCVFNRPLVDVENTGQLRAKHLILTL